MASRDGHSDIKAETAVNVTAITGEGATVGAIIDTHGYDSVEFLIQAGGITSGALLVPSFEHGDASNLSDTAAVTADEIIGTIAGASFSKADDNLTKRIGYKGGKRYVRETLTAANETAASGTATLAADLAAAEKVTIESVDFVCKAKYASNIVTAASVQAADTVTIAGVEFAAVNGGTPGEHEFDMSGTDAQCAASLAAAVNAATDAALVDKVTAANVGGQATVTFTSDVAGAAGNLVTLVTSNGVRLAVTTAGGKLAGAYDPASDEWPIESTLALSATALAAAISASANAAIDGIVTAAAAEAVVTITAVEAGTAGNALTLAKTGAHITVSGSGTLAGGVNAVGTIGSACILGHPRFSPVPQ